MIVKAITLVAIALLATGCFLVDSGDVPTSQPLTILQDTTFVMALMTLLVEVAWMRAVSKNGERWRMLYSFGVLAYASHMLVYYTAIFAYRADIIHSATQTTFLTDWSSVLRWHSVGFVLTSGVQRLWSISPPTRILDFLDRIDKIFMKIFRRGKV